MAEVKWIKIVTDIFDDEKIKLIEDLPDGDSIIVCWFKLLCLAGKQNNSGVLMLNERIAYTDEMLATVFRRPLQTVRLALETFEQFGMIEIINGAITIPNWGKHQNLEGLELVREQTRKRVQKYREQQKLLSDCSVTCNATVTQSNATDIDIDKNKKKNKSKSVFVPPTVEEVREYVKEKGYNIDADYFWSYYNESDWIDKNNEPVLNWKLKLVTWAKKEEEKPKKRQYTTAAEYKAPTKIDVAALESIRRDFKLEK